MTDELPCTYRTPEPIGTIYCGCQGGTRPVYGCSYQNLGGYAILHSARAKRRFITLNAGETRHILSLKLPICAVCPYRPEAKQELKDLFLHSEPPPNLGRPARSESLQNALEAICSNCPRIDSKGRLVTCSGPESISCPQSLWPNLEVVKKTSKLHHGSGCCH
jgi:hypothetical protein